MGVWLLSPEELLLMVMVAVLLSMEEPPQELIELVDPLLLMVGIRQETQLEAQR